MAAPADRVTDLTGMLLANTLGRYLFARFLRTILLVFATVFGLAYLLDFIELLRRSGDIASATPAVLAKLSLYRTPAVAEQIMPFAVLFGAMTALLQLSRKLELVVARAAGISVWQFLQPGIFVALLLGGLAVTGYNPLSAALKQRAARIEAQIFSQGAKGLEPDLWIRQKSVDGYAVIRAQGAVAATNTVTRAVVFTFDMSDRFQERIEASDGTLHDGYWEFSNARVMSEEDEPQTYSTYLLASNLDATQVRQSLTPPESVSFWQLGNTIARAEGAGLDPNRYRLRYAVLLARPLLFVAMVLIAASVSLRFFRFGGVARLVLGGVAAAFVLYVVTEIMRDLGGAGLVGSFTAAWLPAAIGSLLGALTLLHQEDG